MIIWLVEGRTMQRFSRIVARNSAAGMVTQAIIKLLSFGFSVLIVRRLGAAEFGQYAAVLAYGALFVFIADLGLSPYTVREVARLRDAADGETRIRALYGNVLSLRFLLSLLAATLLIGSAWLTGRPLVMVVAIALGTLGLVMYSAQGVFESMLSGYERVDLASGSKIVYQVVFVLVGGLALWKGLGYYGLIGANLLGIALLTYTCLRAARTLGVRPAAPSLRDWPHLLRASLPFGVISFTLGLSYKFDSVLLNIFHGDVATGYYNAAYNLVFSTVILSNIINTALYPSLTRQATTAPESLASIYARALRYLVALALPISVGVTALAPQIVTFLFGSDYAPAIPALRIVIWVVPLMFLSEFLGYIVVVAGREGRVARAIMVSTGVNIALNSVLVPRFGVIAAATMTVITEAVLVAQYLWLLRRELGHISWGKSLGRPVAAAVMMGLLVAGVAWLPVLISVALGMLAYAGLCVALGVIGPDEWNFIRHLRQPMAQGSTG